MSQFFVFPPGFATASPNASVGTNGSVAPTSSTEVAGKDGGGLLKPLSVDSAGVLNVNVSTLSPNPLPVSDLADGSISGGTAGTKSMLAGALYNTSLPSLTNGQQAALQVDSSSRLILAPLTNASIVKAQLQDNAGTAIVLGQALMAASVPVVIASNQSTLPVSAASLPLPSGAATSALQSQISAQIPTTLGAHVTSASLAVNIASDQTVPVSSLQLPAALGAQLIAGSVAVNIASNQTVPVSAASLPLPSGAATSALQSTISGQLPASLGQKVSASSLAVVIASDQSAVGAKLAGKAAVDKARNNYASVNVTTSAYVLLIASTAAAASEIFIFDSSGQTLFLAFGGAGVEVDQLYIVPGGNGVVPIAIPASTRISIKAVSATANAGEIDINLLG